MAPTVAVITSIYGGVDEPCTPAEQDTSCEWVLVTDQYHAPPPWRLVTEPRPHLGANFASKIARARPDLYSGADILIWADGSLKIHSAGFVSSLVAGLGDNPLGAFESYRHRDSLLDEARVASVLGKYAGQQVMTQAEHYHVEGFPPGWGIWWTGLMIRRRGCPNFGDPWLMEMARWSCECQVSLPYVLRKMGLRPKSLPGPSPHFTIRKHIR
jgi:hypothetical protein